MVVLDTDLIIGMLRRNADSIKKIKELEESTVDIFITSITSYELFKGAYLSSDSARNIQQISDFLSSLKILDFDAGASKINAKIYSQLKKKGMLTNIMDQIIASIVVSRNETLITRNIKHYQNITELRIGSW